MWWSKDSWRNVLPYIHFLGTWLVSDHLWCHPCYSSRKGHFCRLFIPGSTCAKVGYVHNIIFANKNTRKNKTNFDSLTEKIHNVETMWDMDRHVTSKITGHDDVLDYYHDISCDHWIPEITLPCLFISNLEDPICTKEGIPVNLLYKNKNIITLISDRGGHVEYVSGKDGEWWAYKTSLEYFDYFLQKNFK